MIKAKAIHAACSAAWGAVCSRFWKAVANKISVSPTTERTERTYRGTFEGYNQYASRPRQYSFIVVENGLRTRVAVVPTNLLSTVRMGESVDIDTRRISVYAEVVLRVRTWDSGTVKFARVG
jgi:hypothetical protein